MTQGLKDHPLKPAHTRKNPLECEGGAVKTATSLGGDGASISIFLPGEKSIKYTDPDGREFEIEGNLFFKIKTVIALWRVEWNLKKSGNKEDLEKFRALKKDHNYTVKIERTDSGNAYDYKNNIILFNDKKKTGGKDVTGDDKRPAFIGLGHETAHAIDDYEGNIENNVRSLPTDIGKYPNKAEEIAVGFENLLRGAYWKNRPEKLRPRY